MECGKARSLLFKLIDDELQEQKRKELLLHLDSCASCAREWKILTIPRRIGRTIPALEPSPFFYQKLRARLASESQSITIWQIIFGLSRRVVPALATLTLVMVMVFAYMEFRAPRVDLYQAYDSIFVTADRPQRMVIADGSEITDETVLHALAEEDSPRSREIRYEKK